MKSSVLFLILALAFRAGAQQSVAGSGNVVQLNHGWIFAKDSSASRLPSKNLSWQPVSLPHTWNIADVMDDVPGYYRGVGWYQRQLAIPADWKDRDLYLYFKGANQVATVFLNGKKVTEHIGGYTGFYARLTNLVNRKNGASQHLQVKVDNGYDSTIAPLSADFTFYGGIYRDVQLLALNRVHFSLEQNGSRAVYISTPQVSAVQATVAIQTLVANYTGKAMKLKIVAQVLDQNNAIVGSNSRQLTASRERSDTISLGHIELSSPHLWSPDDPYLYRIVCSIRDASTGEVLDEFEQPLGCRWFRFDADQGFMLNGKPCKLVGASRHQDREGMGNAVPDSLAVKDVLLLKAMGANFLRVAHYPQDPVVLQTCDRIGILASVEIPIVNEITESAAFTKNCMRMQQEMIAQNYNHPSVIMWCYMNEVLLRPHFNDNKKRQQVYFSNVAKLAFSLDSLTRQMDRYRYTMLANHGDLDKYRNAGLTSIPMVVGWNLYPGWYSPEMKEFPVFLDHFHKEFPNTPMMVTEYGADADPRIRSTKPERFDKSVEYATAFHQYYMEEMMKRPFVAGAVVWNLADFNSETRTETMPHINNKGLTEWDRTPKDPYYLYQALLLKKPFLKILSTCWNERIATADSGLASCKQLVQVASNQDSVELICNDQSLGKVAVYGGLASWELPFKNGNTRLEARAGTLQDTATIQFHVLPWSFAGKPGGVGEMNILLGADRYYLDRAHQLLWQPDQAYHAGSWGHVGGRPFKISKLPYGTDKNIDDTNDDPLFQTQQTGIKQYKLDLPAGDYELTMYFAELLGGNVKGLAYDLYQGDRTEQGLPRVFNVEINGKPVLKDFSIAEQYGLARPVVKQVNVHVTGSDGIDIRFTAIKGEAVLNALQVKQLMQSTN